MLQRYAELQKVPNFWDILHKNVIIYLHRFERALQFVHQFWIEATHAIGKLHTKTSVLVSRLLSPYYVSYICCPNSNASFKALLF